MALSADQIYLLNTLTYLTKHNIVVPSEGMCVEDFVAHIQNAKNMTKNLQDAFQKEAQIEEVCTMIMNDPTLKEMVFSATATTEGGADCFIITSPATAPSREAVVVFEGTVGGIEWRDNFYGGTKTGEDDGVSTREQVLCKQWYESPEIQTILQDCDYVTVTGHSKGGNKAKYLTILDEVGQIDRCISFDGQGFSDEFMEEYASEIAKRQDKITNYNNSNDYVSILLNDVGTCIYNKGDFCDPLNNHSLFTMNIPLDAAENQAKQNPILAEVDNLLNSYLRTLNPDEKKVLLNALAEIVAATAGSDPSGLGNILNLDSINELAKLFSYMLARGSIAFADAVSPWLLLNFPYLYAAIKLIAHVDDAIAPDGSDITFDSIPDSSRTLVMDLEWLDESIAHLRRLSNAVNDCIRSINSCASDCSDEGMHFLITPSGLSFRALMSGQVGTPGMLLSKVAKNAKDLSAQLDTLSAQLNKVLTIYEETENRLKATAGAI